MTLPFASPIATCIATYARGAALELQLPAPVLYDNVPQMAQWMGGWPMAWRMSDWLGDQQNVFWVGWFCFIDSLVNLFRKLIGSLHLQSSTAHRIIPCLGWGSSHWRDHVSLGLATAPQALPCPCEPRERPSILQKVTGENQLFKVICPCQIAKPTQRVRDVYPLQPWNIFLPMALPEHLKSQFPFFERQKSRSCRNIRWKKTFLMNDEEDF